MSLDDFSQMRYVGHMDLDAFFPSRSVGHMSLDDFSQMQYAGHMDLDVFFPS